MRRVGVMNGINLTCWYSALLIYQLESMHNACVGATTYMRSCVLLSASENSMISIPSPVYLKLSSIKYDSQEGGRSGVTYQCKNARRLYMAVN